MPSSLSLSVLALLLASAAPAISGDGLVEPSLHIERGGAGVTHVALTLDACSGQTDQRILGVLVENDIPATIFVTARWIRHNQPSLAVMKSRPDLFEIENHGENHVPAVDRPVAVYGIAAAGSPEAVRSEVEGGAHAIMQAGFPAPRWFRGATARYSPSAIAAIRAMGYEIAGYSVNGDGGSLLPARVAERKIAEARNGDVVIAHINQPTHEAGAGVVRGILALKARGVVFTRLDGITSGQPAGAVARQNRPAL